MYTGLRKERVGASKQHRDGTFRNSHGVAPGLKGNPLPILADFAFGGAKRRPPGPVPVESPLAAWTAPIETGLRVTWLGHSTLLLESDGMRVLTDPVFGDRASPVSFAGARRFHEVPARLADLPRLDAVLLSHDHYDHLCRTTVRELARMDVPIVTALGVGARLAAMGVPEERIVELDWWESHAFHGGLRLTATPSQHFSGRSLTDRNRTLWASWVIETAERRLFFSGDTGLTEEFREIARRFGPFDLTMLEIGAWNAAWGDIHLGPENALTAFEWLGGGTLLPVHWATFDLGLHPWEEPAETLTALAEARGARVVTPRIGRTFEPSRVETIDPWWREVRQAGRRAELVAPPAQPTDGLAQIVKTPVRSR